MTRRSTERSATAGSAPLGFLFLGPPTGFSGFAPVEGARQRVSIELAREVVTKARSLDPMRTPESHGVRGHCSRKIAGIILAAMRSNQFRTFLLQHYRMIR